jgi:hypothetical protein
MKKSELFALLSVALLASVMVFASCKKDDGNDNNKATGAKAADELCDCVTKAGDNLLLTGLCLTNLKKQYSDYVEIDITSLKLNIKDQAFAKDFGVAAGKCIVLEGFLNE